MILESFSKVQIFDDAGKPLNYKTVEKLCFIRSNGPNRLTAQRLIRVAFDEKFEGYE